MRLRKRQVYWLGAIGLVALVGIALWWSVARREPSFQGRSLSAWLLDFNSPDEGTRRRAAEAMRALGKPAVPYLVRALQTKDRPWKKPFADMARFVDEKSKPRIYQIVRPEKEYSIRLCAVFALQELGPDAAEAVSALGESLRREQDMISWNASRALARIGAPAVPELIASLKSGDLAVFQRACDALAEIGASADAAVPALVTALSDAVVKASAAARALGRIGAPSVPALRAALANADGQVREYAALALGMAGPSAREALPDLVERAKDADVKVRRRSVEALGKIRPSAPDIVAALSSALEDPDEAVRLQAVSVFAQSPGAARRATPALTRALQDRSEAVRQLAARVLRELEAAHGTEPSRAIRQEGCVERSAAWICWC